MKKTDKEKIADRPGLYWFHISYLGYFCFFFLTWCIKLPLASNWIDKYRNPIMAGIAHEFELFFVILCLLTSLWVTALFFSVSYKKKVFYRKWLKQSLLMVFITFVLTFSMELIRYLTRPKEYDRYIDYASYSHPSIDTSHTPYQHIDGSYFNH